MSLHFVNLTGGDAALGSKDRRLLRSHAMKGRGGRKPRSSARHLSEQTPTKRVLERFDCPGCSEAKVARKVHTCACYKGALDVWQPIWNDLAVVSVPYQLNKRLRGLIYQCHLIVHEALHPPKFCAQSDAMITSWIRHIFKDEAYLQCSLACMASYADYFVGQPHVSPRAMGYLAKAYALTNEQLSGPAATSLSTIATVTTLAMYQRVHHLQSIGLLHFEGLRRIIWLRGGMARLARDDHALALKPWRLDLEFALQDGSPVRFVDAQAPPAIFSAPNPPLGNQDSISPIIELFGLDPSILGAFIDIRHFTSLLNGVRENGKLDPFDFTQHVEHLIYRLLRFAALLDLHRLSSVDALLHVTLVTFMATLLPEYGRQHAQYALLRSKIKAAILVYRPEGASAQDFIMWTCFVGGISVFEPEDDNWLLPLVQKICQDLNINSWEEVRAKLSQICWIAAVHDQPGRRLHEAVSRSSAGEEG